MGYAIVTVVDIALFGFGARPAALVSQGLTLTVCSVALVLALRGRTGPAAILTLSVIWIELQSGVPITGIETSGLIAYPVLISAAGILLGGRVGYRLAAVTTLSLGALTVIGQTLSPDQTTQPALSAYLIVVTSASMFAAAALVQLGLDSLATVLLSAQTSERRLSDLLAHAPDGIIATDETGRIVSANPMAELLVGRSDLEGTDLRSVLESAVVDVDDLSRLRAMLRPEAGSQGIPLRLRQADEGVFWVDARVSPVAWADGRTGVQLTLRDVTERRRAEEDQRLLRAQLEHAQRLEAVGRLAGGVAHEFNNLLTIVGSSAEMLLAETAGTTRDMARDILEAKVRGAALTKQLLAFARKDLIQPRRISLTEVARDMEVLLGRFLTENVRFLLDTPDETPPVVADRAQIEQIVVNLVINAKDAIDGRGNVTVGVHPGGTERSWNTRSWTVEEGFVELSVVDNGHGMDEDVLERIFEPFYSTKPRGRGTGLGLATVHGTVVQNGGRIRVYSDPGVGTAVVVSWPVVPGA